MMMRILHYWSQVHVDHLGVMNGLKKNPRPPHLIQHTLTDRKTRTPTPPHATHTHTH